MILYDLKTACRLGALVVRYRLWREDSLAENLKPALIGAGPLFIKFGQMLSTRRDLIPSALADSLSALQDDAPPFSSERAMHEIEKAFKKPVHSLFARFEEQPIAAGSIAQVHRACLKTGEKVVVKVLRPHVEKHMRRDVRLLARATRVLAFFSKKIRVLALQAVVQELHNIIENEVDLLHEAANASLLKRCFKDNPHIKIPAIYWEFATKRVIVMSEVQGIPIKDKARLQAAGVDLSRLAKTGISIFFTSVFEYGVFHADLHPGNIFIDATDPENPSYVLIDFGIVSTLSRTDQHYLAENLYAFLKRDYRRVAELHLASGWVPASTRVDAFETALRCVCEPLLDRPISEASFGHMLIALFKTAHRFQMKLQPQLLLLQKTLLNIEGVARDLDPALNVWEAAEPAIQTWMKKQYDPRQWIKKIQLHLPQLAELFFERVKEFR